MAKKIFKLDRFDGGLNNNSLARDIALDEVADISNLMVDEVGQIRLMGDFVDHAADNAQITDFTPIASHNLFSYSTDFLANGNETGEDWVVFADSNASNGMYIYANSTDSQAFSGVLSMGSSSNTKVVFHNVDGRLYVTDGNFSNASVTNKIREYIKATYFPDNTVSRSITAWTDYNNTLAAPTIAGNFAVDENPTKVTGTQSVHLRVDQTGTGTWSLADIDAHTDRSLKFFYSYVLRNGSETILKRMTQTDTQDFADKQVRFEIYITEPSGHGDIASTIPNQVKGVRVYWQGRNTSTPQFENKHFLIADIDFEKGVKFGTASYYDQNYEAIGNSNVFSHSSNADYEIGTWGGYFTNPADLAFITYEDFNGAGPEDVITDIRYKSSVVSNRKVYIGNVQYDSQTFGDRMLKSEVNRFSTFSRNSVVEVTVNDGDEITALQAYADRILQFKKKKMHIINVSKAFEFLEDTFVGKGCEGKFATTRTDFGVAWVNENGCYLYNGRNVINLLEEGKKAKKLISDSVWSSFYNEDSSIGYSPKNRNIIVMSTSGNSNNDIFIYNIPTRSWTKGTVNFGGIKSNFTRDYNQDLIIIDGGSTSIANTQLKKWNNNSDATTSKSATLVLRDADFGQPAIKKHIQKVSISYTGSTNLPAVTFDTNGGSDLNSSFSSALGNQSDFSTLELVPSSSVRDVNSFQIKFNGTINNSFKLSDVSIIYREKTAR